MTVALERTAARTLVDERLFGRLAARVATEHEFTREYAERVVDQALAFLGAAAVNRREPISPSPIVDIGWHTFILYTHEYTEFCARVAHRFIHHVPDDADDARSPGDPIEVRHKTVEAIESAGYRVDRELWFGDKRNLCSPCHNGCADDPPPDPPPKKGK